MGPGLAINATGLAAGWSQLAERLGVALAIAASAVLLAFLARSAARRWLRHALPPHVYKPVENLLTYTILGAGLAASLTPFGIDPLILVLTGGVAGLALGFASQTVASNLLSGLFLLVERPFQIGDPVALNGVQGVVVDVNAFSTVVRTWDGTLVRLPNEKVFSGTIMNLARTAARRVELTVGISYSSSVEEARRAIEEVVWEHPFCLVKPEPEVFVEGFGDSAVKLRVRCWTPMDTWFDVVRTLPEMVYRALRSHGVEIPYPQLDLHVRDLPAGLEAILRAGLGMAGREGVEAARAGRGPGEG